MVPHEIGYYWLWIAPTCDPQIVHVLSGGRCGHLVDFLGSGPSLTAVDFEFWYPDAQFSAMISVPPRPSRSPVRISD